MSKQVTVYTTSTCPHCVTAKEYLQEKGVDFTEKNVQQDNEARKMLMEKGIMAVPVIEIEGELITGLDKEKIDSLLE